MSIEPSPEGPTFAVRDTLEPVTVSPADPREVPHVITPLSEAEIATALDLGHAAAFGMNARSACKSIAWAMICLETGRGKALHNYNFGNVDASPDWHGPIFYLTADEGHGAGTHRVRKALRSYERPFAGAIGWWQFMAAHYPGALVAFDSGDGNATVRALTGYFTGDKASYAAALVSLATEYRRKGGRL